MTLLPDWEPLHVSNIFTPAILICDREKDTQEKEKFRNLGTYRELFYENNVLQKRVILLGKAGAGKTTLCKHLTDVWCDTKTEPQFSDVDEVKQFQNFFNVSCRFAEEKETILDMIINQLFDDETIKAVAIYMLKYHPECCLIVLDGADEWKGSPTSETGSRGDIAGLPSMVGVEGCVILITSRPWRFQALSTKARGIFRLLKISGIKNVHELAYRILEQLEDPDPYASSYEFLRQIREKNMSALMEIPLLLVIALGGWVNDKSLHRSITVNYIHMIQSFISRSKGQAGWSSSESKLRQLVPHLETLETAWGEKSNELPHLLSKYQSIRRYAGLFLSLGQLAFELLLGKEELVFSKKVFKSYLPADDENDDSVNVCLALGILSKTETTTRGLRKLESYAFCHKTFQEFLAALWLASKYSNKKSKMYKCIKSYDDLMSYEILIRFLCGFEPEAGKRFWMFVAEEVEIVEEEMMEAVTDLVCKCMKEHGFDQKDQRSDQIFFCIPHIVKDEDTSNEDIMLFCHVMEEYPCNVKSLCVGKEFSFVYRKQHLSGQQTLSIYRSVSSCSGLQSLRLYNLQTVSEERGSLSSPVLDLQKHDKLKTLRLQDIYIEGLLLPVEGARITSLTLYDVRMTHHGCEQLSKSLSSCSHIEYLTLIDVRCREHSDSSCIPVLDLQKHDKLEELELEQLSIEGLLLPVEGARITLLTLWNVTMPHHGCEKLSEFLSSCSHLGDLSLGAVRCREHSDNRCIPVLDLHKHDNMKLLGLERLSIKGLLLPVEGARMRLNYVTMTHHGCEQMSESLSSCSHLEYLSLIDVRCREHSDSSCIPVLDLQKHDKLEELELEGLSIDGLLLHVEGARITSLKLDNVTMTHHGCEQLSESLISCSHLEDLSLGAVRCREHSDSCCIPVLALHKHDKLEKLELERLSIKGQTVSEERGSLSSPVLDLQKHDKLETLRLQDIYIEGLLLFVEGARIISLKLDNVTMSHHDCEQLSESVSSSSCLYLYLIDVRCREHSDSCCIPVLALQKHDKLEELELWSLSIEGLLLPVEGARIKSLKLDNVTMTHHGCEQLSGSLTSCSHLQYLDLNRVRCREHRDSCCIPVLALQKHDNLKILWLQYISTEALRLPVEGARITSLRLVDVTMAHHGCEQLSAAFLSRPELVNWRPFTNWFGNKVICREHSDSSCQPVKDITNFIKSHRK